MSDTEQTNEQRKNNSRQETVQELHKVSLLIYDAFIQLKDILAMPTDSNIERIFYLSVGLFLLTGLCAILHLFTFISWQGAGINLIIIIVYMVKMKGDANAITKAYIEADRRLRALQTRKKIAKRRSKSK